MARIVPSEVVRVIDRFLPWAKKPYTENFFSSTERSNSSFSGMNILPGLIEMLNHVPEGLVILEPSEVSVFLMAWAALSGEFQLLISGQRRDAIVWPVLDINGTQRDCVEIVRTALRQCDDEAVSISGTKLEFLKDSDLETILQTDLGSVERALANGEWKAATVIAGSIIEALLLWAIKKREASDIEAAIQEALSEKKLSDRPHKNRDKWNLHELIEVAHQLEEISKDTLGIVRPSKNFRNAIHPGKVNRTGIRCDRGMAYTTYSAVLNIAGDLSRRKAV
jgi:hypothetical protein